MTKVYGIVGAGKASTKAIRTALDDLEKDAVFYVPFFRSTSVEDVYDWLLDNERDYVLIGNRASRILMETAKEIIHPDTDDLNIAVIDALSGTDATLLVLWDDDNSLVEAMYKAHSGGHRILELSNGLAPITIEDDLVVSDPIEEEPVKERDISNFSREEMEIMPMSALKRQAVLSGINIKGMASKAAIIDALQEVKTPVAVDTLTVTSSPAAAVEEREETSPVASITVLFKNGTVANIQASQSILERMFAAIS